MRIAWQDRAEPSILWKPIRLPRYGLYLQSGT